MIGTDIGGIFFGKLVAERMMDDMLYGSYSVKKESFYKRLVKKITK